MPRPFAQRRSPSWAAVADDAKLAAAYFRSRPDPGSGSPEVARTESPAVALAHAVYQRVLRKAHRASANGRWAREPEELASFVVRRTFEEVGKGQLELPLVGVPVDRHLTLHAFQLLDDLRPALLRRHASSTLEDFDTTTRSALPRLDEDCLRRFRRRVARELAPHPHLLVCAISRLDFEFVGDSFATPAATLRHAFHKPSVVVQAALGGIPGAPYRQLRRRGAFLLNVPTRAELSQVGCDDLTFTLFRDPTLAVSRTGTPTRTAVLQAALDYHDALDLDALGDRRLHDRLIDEAKQRVVEVALAIGRLRAA